MKYFLSVLAGLVVGVLLTLLFSRSQEPTVTTETVVETKTDTVWVTHTDTVRLPTPDPIVLPDLDNTILVKYEDLSPNDFLQVRRYEYPIRDSVLTGNITADVVGFMEGLTFDYSIRYPEVTNNTTTTITRKEVRYRSAFPIWIGGQISTDMNTVSVMPRVGLHLKRLSVYYGYDHFNSVHSAQVSIPLNSIF